MQTIKVIDTRHTISNVDNDSPELNINRNVVVIDGQSVIIMASTHSYYPTEYISRFIVGDDDKLYMMKYYIRHVNHDVDDDNLDQESCDELNDELSDELSDGLARHDDYIGYPVLDNVVYLLHDTLCIKKILCQRENFFMLDIFDNLYALDIANYNGDNQSHH